MITLQATSPTEQLVMFSTDRTTFTSTCNQFIKSLFNFEKKEKIGKEKQQKDCQKYGSAAIKNSNSVITMVTLSLLL